MLYATVAADRKRYTARRERHEAREKRAEEEDAVEIADGIAVERDAASAEAL